MKLKILELFSEIDALPDTQRNEIHTFIRSWLSHPTRRQARKEAICEACGVIFKIKHHGRGGPKFCSRECRNPAHENPESKFLSIGWEVTGDGCWEWQGRLQNGYGVFDHKGKAIRATLFSWVRAGNDPPPLGWVMRHKCDNPPCVNPDHLIPGTHADNVADKVARNRQAKGPLLKLWKNN